MNKWLSAFVALTLLLPNLPTAQGDISQTCPSESRRHRAYGKRVDAKSCLTLVFRDELMKLTNMSHISAINRAAEYCNEFFKHGSLVMYVPTMFPLKELEQLDFTHLMLLSTNRSPWNSFLCLHQPYNDCEERTYQNCVYDEASNSCVWQYTYHKIIDAEQPYGNMCPSYDNLMAGKPCSSCQKCSKTEWTSWKEYTDSEGNRFKIHYRPMDNKPCHSCYTDTSVCCSEYEIIGKNHTETIQCFYGTRNFNSTSAACNCSSNATGEFCEISTFSSEGEKVRTSNTVLLGKYTHQQKHIYDGTLIYEFLLKWVTIILLVIIALVAVFMPCTQLVCNVEKANCSKKKRDRENANYPRGDKDCLFTWTRNVSNGCHDLLCLSGKQAKDLGAPT
ncbi:hypothetical protein D918_07684 [Trichuris suis]|nr:hypothetical protein D918_07684 [Trichuris suis]